MSKKLNLGDGVHDANTIKAVKIRDNHEKLLNNTDDFLGALDKVISNPTTSDDSSDNIPPDN